MKFEDILLDIRGAIENAMSTTIGDVHKSLFSFEINCKSRDVVWLYLYIERKYNIVMEQFVDLCGSNSLYEIANAIIICSQKG